MGDLVVEFDPEGNIAWKVRPTTISPRPTHQRAPGRRPEATSNGNTVITSYRAGGDAIKLTEVTPDKKIVWTHQDPKRPGIHHFQILEPDGKVPAGRPLR